MQACTFITKTFGNIFVSSFSGPTTISRAAYARLSSAGFPSIVDRLGNPPLVIDPKEEVPLNLENEGVDQLLGNEIIVQFLALSRCVSKNREYVYHDFLILSRKRVSCKM